MGALKLRDCMELETLLRMRIFNKWLSVLVATANPVGFASVLALVGTAQNTLHRGPPVVVAFCSGGAALSDDFRRDSLQFLPYVVPEKIMIYEAASAPECLFIILIGPCIVSPTIMGYTILSHVIFRGKADRSAF
jgi:cytochrome bd-type quinol oxidase subunit 2